MSVLWPSDLANGLHLIVIFTLSLILTSFIYASVCEKASISYSSLAGFKTGTLNLLTHFHSTHMANNVNTFMHSVSADLKPLDIDLIPDVSGAYAT